MTVSRTARARQVREKKVVFPAKAGIHVLCMKKREKYEIKLDDQLRC